MNLFIPVLILLLSFCNSKENQLHTETDSGKKESEMLLLKVTWFEGDINILRDNTNIKVEQNLELENNDLVRTGSTGTVELLLGLDHSIKVGNNSQLSITNLLTTEGETATNISIHFGSVLIIISKETKEKRFTLITPDALVGIDDSIIVAQVSPKEPKPKNTQCDNNSCITKLIVLNGAIHITQSGNSKDLVVEKNSQIFISKEKELSQDMIITLDRKNLSEFKGIMTFYDAEHSFDTKILEDYKIQPDVKQKPYIKLNAENIVASKGKVILQKKPKLKTVSIKKINQKKIIQKDFHREKLKLDSNRKF